MENHKHDDDDDEDQYLGAPGLWGSRPVHLPRPGNLPGIYHLTITFLPHFTCRVDEMIEIPKTSRTHALLNFFCNYNLQMHNIENRKQSNCQVGTWSSGRLLEGREGRLVSLAQDSGRSVLHCLPAPWYNTNKYLYWKIFINLKVFKYLPHTVVEETKNERWWKTEQAAHRQCKDYRLQFFLPAQSLQQVSPSSTIIKDLSKVAQLVF